MSRCFPFPPPGYEKKLKTDELDLLKKEKHKEKKHKKDKKDREKKEGKEKREKDRSERKHKEKKEKKDKHKEKKKDKEKGKSITSDDKKVSPFENENNEHNKPSVPVKNGGYEQAHKKAESFREKSTSSDDKKSSISYWGQNGENPFQNQSKAKDPENFKFVQELDRRIRDEEKGTGSHQFLVESRKSNHTKVDETGFGRNAMVQNKVNGMPPSFDKRVEEKERSREKERDEKRKNKDRDIQRQGKEKDAGKEKKEERPKDFGEKERNKQVKKIDTVASLNNLSTYSPKSSIQGFGSEGNFKKRKDTETNGSSHETELRPNKMARHSPNILTENGRKPDFLPKPSSNPSDKPGFKDRRVNGMISSQPASISATKPPKSPPLITNHLSTPPFPVSSATKLPPSVPNHIAPQPPAPPPVSSKTSPSPLVPIPQKPSPQVANKAPPQPLKKKSFRSGGEPSTKPPHPDTKYLNRILSVPKMDPWCGFVDQDWLFHDIDTDPSSKIGSLQHNKDQDWIFPDKDNDPSSRKGSFQHNKGQDWRFSENDNHPYSKTESLHENDELQVWSEATHIESVGVCALPYVIPY